MLTLTMLRIRLQFHVGHFERVFVSALAENGLEEHIFKNL